MPASLKLTSDRFRIADVDLTIHCDDPLLLTEFASLFGCTADGPPSSMAMSVSVTAERQDQFGEMTVEYDTLRDPLSFLLSFASPDIPLRAHPRSSSARPMISLGNDPEPLFIFEGQTCLFRKVPRWRRILSHLIFLRLLRKREDVIFLHAATVEVNGRGLLLVGPKGSGKTTTALALSVRGHKVLGDETAIYEPATGRILPFARPVSIKQGPAAARVRSIVNQRLRTPDEDGVMRLGIREFVSAPAQPVPLRTIIFLKPFGDRPSLERVQAPGNEEVSMLQPLATSLAGAGSTRRIFQMIKLCSTTPIFHLSPADPDETAGLIEEVLASYVSDRC
jgi:hypothetical protein